MRSAVDLMSWDDEELVERARKRGATDDRPFTILFERHQPLVWRVCYRFTGNTADAEDLLQEVFIKAYHNLRGFERRSTFRTWLYQIAINTCRNELRSRKRRPISIEAHMDDLELVDLTANPAASASLDFEAVAAAIMELREEDREILLMRDMDERPFADIAQTLGVQVSAAKMRVQRARLALVAAVHAHDQGENSG